MTGKAGEPRHLEAEADCMYWLKHEEAALIIAVLHNLRPFRVIEERVRTGLIRKLAHQWAGYEKLGGGREKTPLNITKAITELARQGRKSSKKKKPAL